MKRIDALIYQARLISRNTANADGTKAISDEEILQYLNDAQDRMQNLISAQKNIAKIFVTQKIISIVGNQEAYTIPDRVLLNKQIENVEFSATGNLSDYVRIEKVNLMNRDTNTTTYPWGYFKRGNQLFLQPTPSTSTGTLRVTYERELDDLDIIRGTINTITGGTSTQFTTITLSTNADAFETTTPGWTTGLGGNTGISIVDAYGVPKVYSLPVSGYDTTTNILTPLPSPYIYGSSDTALAVGDSCVFGNYATTYSQLPDSCERYLIHYAANELFHRDSSNDGAKETDILDAIEKDTIKAVIAQTSEVQFVPTIDRYDWF
jgi:hypothetical protein